MPCPSCRLNFVKDSLLCFVLLFLDLVRGKIFLHASAMSGCSKRCKHGIVKFAQTIFKLITGTLSKGKRIDFDSRCSTVLSALLEFCSL